MTMRALVAILLVVMLAGVAVAGPVIVRTQPPSVGAELRVGGVSFGTTGSDGTLIVEGLPAGEHRLELVLANGTRFQRATLVSAGHLASQVIFDVPRAPATDAQVLISGNVGGALIEVDGQAVGNAGGTDGSLLVSMAVGQRRVRLSAPGYEPGEQVVDVRPGPVLRVPFELRRAAVPEAAAGAASSGRTDNLVLWLLLGLLAIAVAAVVFVAVHVVRRQGRTGERVPTRRIDRYEVREVVGRGGMATIYRATDTLRGAKMPVALKVMDEAHLRDPDLVHKFLREGEILQQLNEADPEAPLVRVYHFGTAANDGGRPFIAMEYLEGQDLLRHLKSVGRLRLEEAAGVMAGVSRALVPAHAAGVYHRDLTPDNVILTRGLRGGYALRLIDFGVARHEYTAHGTLDGSIAGKPPYMSPEQCQGKPVDGRSDIYALGIMLYTLVTGAPPFVSPNPLEVMRLHKEAEVPFPADFPEAARPVVEKALAKDRNARHRDIRAFLHDVDGLRRG
jgi:tRNA A-37 threonylcarbamoyl transferase component Bud32